MTITNIILTNQRRPYKWELQHLQQKLDKIDMSYHLQRCVIIIGGASEILVWQSVKKTFKSSKMWCVSNVVYSIAVSIILLQLFWPSNFKHSKPIYRVIFLTRPGVRACKSAILRSFKLFLYILHSKIWAHFHFGTFEPQE